LDDTRPSTNAVPVLANPVPAVKKSTTATHALTTNKIALKNATALHMHAHAVLTTIWHR
ncbi:hypothetical protein H0H87_002253, partial [Tephrocybe sp. NHM501043]